METSEMVERVARVIETKSNYVISQHHAKALARAAIATMREPTEAMQVAGHNIRNHPETGLQTFCGVDEIYTVMIEAALE